MDILFSFSPVLLDEIPDYTVPALISLMVAGGMDAVLSSLNFLYKEAGINRSRKLLANFNQVGGFECPGCETPAYKSVRVTVK